LHFEMGVDATYEGAKVVTLDAEAAVKAAPGEAFMTGKNYQIRFVGVTDLAGNIEVSSEHYFNVKFKDAVAVPPTIVKPVVKEIVQVADNIFRVEFNRVGVEGTLVVENPDGNGVGTGKIHIPPSAKSANGKYYSYVSVPAVDHEPLGYDRTGLFQDEVLAYDGQDTLYRTVKVEDVVVLHDSVSAVPLHGDDRVQNNMKIVDDILAPVVVNPVDKIDYGTRGNTLSFNIKDVVPWGPDENAYYWVSPIAYEYNAATKRFGNNILADQQNADTYLPVKVSYIDASGAKHQAIVSNYDLRPFMMLGVEVTDENPGAPGNITFDDPHDIINLDLSMYPQLLGSDGKLVPGVTYTVEFPQGYFTDAPKDINWSYDGGGNDAVPSPGFDFWFNGIGYDVLNVDDGRQGNFIWWIPIDKGLGYTSTQQTVTAQVAPKPPGVPAEQHVPQTSKQLISYDEPTKSMKIEFTGTIDVATLKDKNNYSFDGKTLAEWDAELGTNTVIDYVVNNSNPNDVRQYAVFKIPQDSIKENSDVAFIVSGVAAPDGGKMTPVETVVGLRDNYRPVVVEAKVQGDRQILLTFNEPIRYNVDVAPLPDEISTAKNFKVMINGMQYTVLTAVLSVGGDENNKREIILNLGNDIPAAGDITVQIVPDQNQNILVIDKSENKNPLKAATYNVTRP